MRIKVELHQAVWNCLQDRLTPAERESFSARLEDVRRAPIRNSEASHDPRRGPYMLRFFRFGAAERWIAIIEYDIARARIKVLECRLLRPRRPGPGSSGHDGGT